MSLLEQYSAVSYGDELFARYILLAIRQNQSVVLRRLFWLDHTHITSIFTVGLNKVCGEIMHFINNFNTIIIIIINKTNAII